MSREEQKHLLDGAILVHIGQGCDRLSIKQQEAELAGFMAMVGRASYCGRSGHPVGVASFP